MRRQRWRRWGRLAGRITFTIGMFAFFIAAVMNVSDGRREEGKQQLEDALRRTAVAVYAAEGAYPPDLAYMQEHYGIRVDEERYKVVYQVMGSNLMPDITVLERQQARQ